VTGYYMDNSFIIHSFVRDSLGTVTDFSLPGSRETLAESISNLGKTVGQWTNGKNLTHGFLRDASGSITSFSVPVLNFGTAPNDINDSGQITGFYIDTSGALHGFVQ
jgi:predicted membrane protein